MLNDTPSDSTPTKKPEPTISPEFRKPSISSLTSPSVAHKPPPLPPSSSSVGSSEHSSARSSPAITKRNSIANIIDAYEEPATKTEKKAELNSPKINQSTPVPKLEEHENDTNKVEKVVDNDDLTKIKKLKQSKKPRRYETPPIWAQRWVPPNRQKKETNVDDGNEAITRLSEKPVFDYTTTRSVDLECSITEKSKRNVELELKFGKIIDKRSGNRIDLNVVTECIFTDHSSVFFDMQVEEVAWKEITKFLDELEKSFQEGKKGRKFKTLESDNTDSFYQLGRKGEHPKRIRVTKDNLLSPPRLVAIQKERVADLYIHNPGSLFDLRLSMSLEIPVPQGNIESIITKNKPEMVREKKRISYTHPPTITKFDLTRVIGNKTEDKYEVELEAGVMEIFAAIDKIQKGVDNLRLEELIEVFLNNARTLNNRLNKIC
ncbi:mRNA capping enzyme, beta chain family protein [Candida albicans]|uniref:mRNA-capping enzyme subunit beta n=1 Tax=Candida albicans TaxID=5476 RepID=A0A8H6BTS6_CANAX|nr:mRNA capping enzyme, beta chain family protein [Candida albicans]